jgi:L-seryl-tRNA(Ser) seleniumtransferase
MPLCEDGLSIMPYMMEPGEERIVARRLLEIFRTAACGPGPQTPAVDLTGRWNVQIRFLRGETRHSLEIRQQGGALSGRHLGDCWEAPLEGTISGNEVTVHSVLGDGSTRLEYTFRGRVQGGMAGTVELGSYGSADWRADREASA